MTAPARPDLPPAALEYCQLPDQVTPNWSESRWVTAYDPEQQIGIFFHAGRLPGDLRIWWGHCVVYLPDGNLIVNRSWGQPDDPRVCATGAGTLAIDEPWERFRLSYAGAGQLTTAQAAAAGPVGAASPAVGLRLELTGSAAAPPWNALAGLKDIGWAAGHFEQAYTISGQIIADGRRYEINGIGATDHSFGPRTWNNFASHNFILGIMPDHVFHTIEIWDADDNQTFYVGTRFDANGQTALAAADFPRISDLAGTRETFDLRLTHASGDTSAFSAEVLHSVATTNTIEKDCIIGVDWDIEPTPYTPVESILKLTASDGAVGYGHAERSRQRSTFDRATGRLLQTASR